MKYFFILEKYVSIFIRSKLLGQNLFFKKKTNFALVLNFRERIVMHHSRSKEEANKLPNNTENCIVGSKVVKLNSEVGREQESGHGTLTYSNLIKGKIV